jgi:hypothetical protein
MTACSICCANCSAQCRLTAICMLVGALITIGLALCGVLQTGGRSPVAQVATK